MKLSEQILAKAKYYSYTMGGQEENARLMPLIKTLAEACDALEEAETNFNSIMSGLTTDINKVEYYTKKLAREAKVEVTNALARVKELV